MEIFALKLRIHNLIGMKLLCEMSESLYTVIVYVTLAFKCLSKYKRKILKMNFVFILILKLRIMKNHMKWLEGIFYVFI